MASVLESFETVPQLLEQGKDKKSSTSAGPTRKKKINKTEREIRQGEAAVTKVAQRAQNEDSTKQHLFLVKYRDILLIKDDFTRIVTDVAFVLDRACWTLMMTGFTSLTPISLPLSYRCLQ
jgi:hypothetical protein